MKLNLKERAEIAELSKDYYERCKKRKEYDKIIDRTIATIVKKVKQLIDNN